MIPQRNISLLANRSLKKFSEQFAERFVSLSYPRWLRGLGLRFTQAQASPFPSLNPGFLFATPA